MHKSLLSLAVVSLLGWPQLSFGQSQTALVIPHLDKGVIQGKTYRNTVIGLDLTPDPSLTFEHPEVRDNGTKRESLMVAAVGRATPGSARDGTALGVVALAYYPEDQRSTDSCMRRVVDAQLKSGFKSVTSSSKSELGGITFARTDFSHSDPPGYEAVFLKACDALALTVVFSGHDRKTVEKLVAATDLKLDPSLSGCRSQAK